MAFNNALCNLFRFLKKNPTFFQRVRFLQNTVPKPRTRPLRRPQDTGHILLIVPIGCVCLGTWQVKRLFWKTNLINDIESKAKNDPIPLPIDLTDSVSSPDLEFTRVFVEGEFDHSKEILLAPRKRATKESGGSVLSKTNFHGANVITPFKLSDRDLTILINRGYIPKTNFDPQTRLRGQVKGKITLSGLIRKSEQKNIALPDDPLQPDGTYVYRDIYKMAKRLGTSPVFIDAGLETTVPEGPIGGQTNINIRNEHLSYIFTWYCLAAATTFMWWRIFRNPKNMSLELHRVLKKGF